MRQNLQELDTHFTPSRVQEDQHWYDIRQLGVEGRAFDKTRGFYDRLPARAQGVVRDAVWSLSQHSAGMRVRFVTDSTRIAARWTLRFESLAMSHMAATGVSGLDLYARHDKSWRWVGTGRPERFPENQVSLVHGELPPGQREYQLYLPLYNGVEQVEIGLPRDAVIAQAPPYPAERRKPICFYGTSIVQGACASRPGMAYPAILARRLDWPHVNLGFSGNGKMEDEVAQLLAQIDAAAFVLDPLPNNQSPDVIQRMAPFIHTLRRAHPHAPIVLVESIVFQQASFVPSRGAECRQKTAALRQVHDRLVNEGVSGLHVVPGEQLLGSDGEATVDGTHPSDLGFMRISNTIEPVLRRVLTA